MKIETRRLENGLSVFLVHIPSARTVCTVFVVYAGWGYEIPGVNVGVSHFGEHMGFKGTTRRPTARDIAYEIEGVGGEGNAVTNIESIRYFVYMPARHSELAIDIVSDLVLNPRLRVKDIELEKTPIKEEYAGVLDNPEAVLSGVFLNKLLFGDHPLGWIGTGTKEDIEKIDRDLIISYMKDFFTGPNSAVICAGNIGDPERLFEVISGYFGGLPSSPPHRQRKLFKDDQTDLRVQLVEKDLEQTLVGVAVKDILIHDRYALVVLDTILGRGMGSRLFLNIRDRLGLVYDVYSDLDVHADVAVFSVFAGLDPAEWKKGLKAIIDELKLIREKGVNEEELLRAKEMLLADIEIALERPDRLALGLAESWSVNGKIIDFFDIERFIKAVSASDIASLTDRLFRAEKLNCVVLGASPSEEEEARAILNALN